MIQLASHYLSNAPVNHEPGKLYTYYFAGNGTFISAAREGLAVAFPIAHCDRDSKKKLMKSTVFCYNGLVKFNEPTGADNTKSALTNSFNVGG
jgi:hypothetical protein